MAAVVKEMVELGEVNVLCPTGEIVEHVPIAFVTTENTYKGETKTSKYYTTKGFTYSEGTVEPNFIRLYPTAPLLQKGELTLDELNQLFSGNTLLKEDLKAKSGNTYSAEFSFSPFDKPSYLKKKTFTGVLEMDFA